MNCKSCGYRLWNLPSRQCPECGTGFAPSEFEFRVGAVAYCCPHCATAYYGTDEKGHLVPRSFICTNCNQAIDMDSMVLRPSEGVDEADTTEVAIPWLRRGEISWWKAWFETVKTSMLKPSQLARGGPRPNEGRAPWSFAAWSIGLTLVVSALPLLLFQFIIMFAMTRPAGGTGFSIAASVALGIGVALVYLVVTVLVMLASIWIWGLSVQAVLWLTGTGHEPRSHTNRALCYSAGANVSTAIPCVGWYFGWVWWLVSAVAMVRETHRIRTGRAALAVLTLPGLSLLGAVGLYALFIWTVFSGMTAAGGGFAVPGFAYSETNTLLNSYISYSIDHGTLPAHPLQLWLEERVMWFSFASSETSTSPSQIRWQGLKVNESDDPTLPSTAKKVKTFVDSLPADAVAHRAGDFIFTCPGADPSKLGPDIWLVIYSPLPGAAGPAPPWGANVYVGQADGTVVSIPNATFQASLQGQIAARKRDGLSPLPLLNSITHNSTTTSGG